MTGNSSVGKTTMVNEFLYHFIMTSPYKVGIISLESDVGELTENLMSLHISKKLANMPDDEKLKLFHSNGFDSAYKDLTHTEEGNDRYYILDHQGAVVDGELMTNIEFLVKSMDCKVIILDPLTLALSGKQNDGMDVFMSDLLRFVKREKVAHVNVVHVRKNQSGSKANSTGAEIHEEDIKGSGSIFQVSMNNILLMRDKENTNPLVRNTTKAMMSKNRRCGNTGPAGFWFYNSETSRMEKGRDPQISYEDSINEFEELGAFEESNLDLVGQDVDNQEESKDNEGYVFKSPD
jgi:replicative DNA helicase